MKTPAGQVREAKHANHLTQQLFLPGVQPGDKDIRGLELVHRVRRSEVVGLGEVVSPRNPDPNGFVRVLLYLDRHLVRDAVRVSINGAFVQAPERNAPVSPAP